MPIIELKYFPKRNKNQSKINNEIHKTVYNTRYWRNLRLQYLLKNPLCENCKKAGNITLAELVHHKNEISNAETIEQKKIIGFDFENLMALCFKCHIQIHKKI